MDYNCDGCRKKCATCDVCRIRSMGVERATRTLAEVNNEIASLEIEYRTTSSMSSARRLNVKLDKLYAEKLFTTEN